jgi:hypothetical protein
MVVGVLYLVALSRRDPDRILQTRRVFDEE